MRVRSCTIDSSCVIALDHLNLVPQLSMLFAIVLVPKAVREDLFKRRATIDYRPCSRISHSSNAAMGTNRALSIPCRKISRGWAGSRRSGGRGAGFAIWRDGHRRRSMGAGTSGARRPGFSRDGVGSSTVSRVGVAVAQRSSGCFESLRQRGIRLPWEAVNAFLTQIGQEPLR